MPIGLERSLRTWKDRLPMPRRTLDRFSVSQPSDGALRRYYRTYDARTLYFAPATLPDITSAALFGNARPLVLDLGCGRGEFIIAQAQQHSDRNHVGLDLQRKYLYDAVNSAERYDLENLLFLRVDLRQVLVKIPCESIAGMYLLFPSPVVKRKHQRKDVLTPVFVAGLADILAPDGSLTLVTDHRRYFERKTALLDSRLRRLQTSEGLEGSITWFQRVWERHGLPSLRAEYAKRGSIHAPRRDDRTP
jgi:tRNA (guanine-N7-)-methyltransferase